MSLSPQRQLDNYLSQFAEKQVDGKYLGLYDGERRFGRVFAWLHEQYNGAFEFMNAKAPQGVDGHFNADSSRDLMEVNETYSALLRIASKAGIGWIGNGVLDRFLEDESLFGEFLRTPVSEGGVESLVVEPPHIVVEVGA